MSNTDLKMVVGFMFNEAETNVLLILKQKPEWQKNKFNGVGGKVEKGESFYQAMVREFKEETGIQWNDWREVVLMYGVGWQVQVFTASTDEVFQFKQMEAEKLRIFTLNGDKSFDVCRKVSNLNWLVPLCLDKNNGKEIIDYGLTNAPSSPEAVQPVKTKEEILAKVSFESIEDLRRGDEVEMITPNEAYDAMEEYAQQFAASQSSASIDPTDLFLSGADYGYDFAKKSDQPVKEATQEGEAIDYSRVKEVLNEEDGYWQSCSGCHETVDGQETGHYRYSDVFNCYAGSGCRECGGLGVIWNY